MAAQKLKKGQFEPTQLELWPHEEERPVTVVFERFFLDTRLNVLCNIVFNELMPDEYDKASSFFRALAGHAIQALIREDRS